MQPTDLLQDAGTLESTLHHELLHMLVEQHAKPGTPLWFREGLVLCLSQPNGSPRTRSNFDTVAALEKALRAPENEQQMREAYADAQTRISKLIAQNGREAVIQWLQEGLPPSQ